MKTGENAKKGLYIGAGAGLVAFALAGLLPGSFIGGLIGLNIAGSIVGTPVSATLLPRLIVGASMILGVMISGTVFVTGASLLGRLAGTVMDSVQFSRESRVEAIVKNR